MERWYPSLQSVQSSTIRQTLGLNSNEVFLCSMNEFGLFAHSTHTWSRFKTPHESILDATFTAKKGKLTQFILDLCRILNGCFYLCVQLWSFDLQWGVKNNDRLTCITPNVCNKKKNWDKLLKPKNPRTFLPYCGFWAPLIVEKR